MTSQHYTESPVQASTAERRSYQSPRLSLLGTVCNLTEAGSLGNYENQGGAGCTGNDKSKMC